MRILSNTAMSLDGKISVNKTDLLHLGTPEDRRRMSPIRAQAEAILVGGNSFRTWPKPLLPREEDRQWDYKSCPVLNVILSATGRVNFSEEYLQEKQIKTLLFTSSQDDFPVETLRFPNGITAHDVVNELKKRGVKSLLVEGGGELIAQFLESRLLTEMYVTLTPKIIGGVNAPSLVQGSGFGSHELKQLKLLSCEPVGDEIFLHYQILK